METNKLFALIDSKQDEYLNFLKCVVELESPTSYKEGVDSVGEYFIERAKEKGWDTQIYNQKIAGNAVAITLNPDSNNKPICLSGHIDTVHPLGSFGDPCVRYDGNKMIGPGVADCKGGCVNAFWAMDALSEMGYRERPVMLLLQSDEESSSRESNKKTIKYIVERSKNAAAFLNLEPMYTGGITLERRGIAKYEFTIKGKQAHASKSHLGASAIAAAAGMIVKLERYKDVNGITFNCGTIKGGTATNTVPDECVFTLDARFKNQKQYDEIKTIVHSVEEEKYVPNTLCTVREISYRPCMQLTEKNQELYERINKILMNTGLETLKINNASGGSDAAYITLAGIPVVDSLGSVGNKIHTREEYIEIDSFATVTKRIAAIISHYTTV